MALRLVVGLGNPGPEYERTRHNVGFRLVDRMVGEADSSWENFRGLGVVAKRGGLWFAKPMTFMNESGQFARAFADYYKFGPKDVLAVYDELALPLGKLRLRVKGSAGGQKGMLSIIKHFGTEEVPRLRIGIGPQPERMDSSDFVLGRFKSSEEEALGAVLDRAAEAIAVAAESGVEIAMTRFNPDTPAAQP